MTPDLTLTIHYTADQRAVYEELLRDPTRDDAIGVARHLLAVAHEQSCVLRSLRTKMGFECRAV